MKYHDSDFIEIKNYDVKMGWFSGIVLALISVSSIICGVCFFDEYSFLHHIFVIGGGVFVIFSLLIGALVYNKAPYGTKKFFIPKSKRVQIVKNEYMISLYYKRLGSYWLWKNAYTPPEELLANYIDLFNRSKKKEGIGEIIYDKRVIV